MSGSVRPLTTTSPWPQAASTTTRSRRPLTGSAVNATPAFSAGAISWTTTAMSGQVVLAVFGPVGDDAGREGRRPALRDRVEQRVGAADVGERGVHAGVGGVGAVLADRGGSHRDRCLGAPAARTPSRMPSATSGGQAGPPDAVLQQEAGRRQAVLGRAGRPLPRGGQGLLVQRGDLRPGRLDGAPERRREDDEAAGHGEPGRRPSRPGSRPCRRPGRRPRTPGATAGPRTHRRRPVRRRRPRPRVGGSAPGGWSCRSSVLLRRGMGPPNARAGGPPPGPPVPWHADLRPSVRCGAVSRGDGGGGSRGCPAGRSGTPRRGRGRAGRSNLTAGASDGEGLVVEDHVDLGVPAVAQPEAHARRARRAGTGRTRGRRRASPGR